MQIRCPPLGLPKRFGFVLVEILIFLRRRVHGPSFEAALFPENLGLVWIAPLSVLDKLS